MPELTIQYELEKRYRRVLAGFVLQGTSLNAWCRGAGVKRQNATKALMDQWKGPRAQQVLARILDAAGVHQ
jgi:lambda repressor-like predicted transcriptional regulator